MKFDPNDPSTAMIYRLNRRLCVAQNGRDRSPAWAEFDTQEECAAWASARGLTITRGANIKPIIRGEKR